MEQPDLLKRLLDAGMTFTAMTQARAEELIRDLVRAGEVQAEQAQATVDELVERSRRNSERLIDAVRGEIRDQVSSLGLATTGDVARVERRIADLSDRVDALAAKAPASRTSAAKKSARKSTKKSTAKKSPAKKSAKRSAAKSSSGS